jgi:O-antigen ligase
MTTKMWNRAIAKEREWRTFYTSPYFLMVALVIVLLLGGVVIELLLDGKFGHPGIYAIACIIGTFFLAIMFILRRDEIVATLIIAVCLIVDWYLGIHLLGLIVTLVLLAAFFLARSPRYPWVEPRAIWLWMLFLLLTIIPAVQGASNFYDATLYFPDDIVGAFLIFWLGTVIARDSDCIRYLFMMLALFGTLIAIHTIIQEITGKFLFETSSATTVLANVSNYQLSDTEVNRVGSFFLDPNWDGTFLAMTLSISLGLFIGSPSLWGKVFYIVEISLILLALLFTFSTGSLIGAGAGVVAFIIFVGRARYRILLPAVILVGTVVIIEAFPTQITAFLQHSSNPNELLLRTGAWETAIRVIEAFPLTGVGLGLQNYALKAEPYRVPAQYVQLVHPHDSYLEWAAMAGLPVLLIFLAILSFALWLTLRNWMIADIRTRSLLGAGIAAAIALSTNSISINGWTLPPLAALGWLVLGACSSPLLTRSLSCKKMKGNTL